MTGLTAFVSYWTLWVFPGTRRSRVLPLLLFSHCLGNGLERAGLPFGPMSLWQWIVNTTFLLLHIRTDSGSYLKSAALVPVSRLQHLWLSSPLPSPFPFYPSLPSWMWFSSPSIFVKYLMFFNINVNPKVGRGLSRIVLSSSENLSACSESVVFAPGHTQYFSW